MTQDEQRQLAAVREDLLREFAGRLSPETVAARFEEVVADFSAAPIRTFVPVIARRVTRERLTRVA